MKYLTIDQERWCDARQPELIALLKELGRIPAPSHHEEKRCEYILAWLRDHGETDAYIDDAQNVILPVNVREDNRVRAVLAHTDIVFPDTEPLEVREEDGRLYAPGIGDDTANLANLLIASRYIRECGIEPQCGLIIAANSCEEGLGNLKGSGKLIETYGARMDSLVSFDLDMGYVCDRAVGSHRYRVRISAQGGHSYGDFGNTNAIQQMAELIGELYKKKVPQGSHTTYNVGTIHGGTTVNSICAQCEILYEYRSDDRAALAEMEAFFADTIASFRGRGYNIDVERIGDRPCGGEVDKVRQQKLSDAAASIMEDVCGYPPETGLAMSTDCNSSLAAGIPSVCIGTIMGGGAHTRGEWMELDSLKKGLRAALVMLLWCCEQK